MKTKTIIATFILLLIMIAGMGFAQAPKKFNYQAIMRDNNGTLIANQNVTLRISIRESSESGTVLYSETHNTITASTGLVSLQIGGGTPEAGYDFSTIDWSYKTKYIQLEIDAAGGNNFENMGSAELLSVPYALYAEESGNSQSKGLAWETTGNAGTLSAINFIGTTDNQDVVFKRMGLRAGIINLTNTSFGLKALNPLVTGTYNTAVGLNALSAIETGTENTSIGTYSLYKNKSGKKNTATGHDAMNLNVSGCYNAAYGVASLVKNTTGSYNVGIGFSAGFNSNGSNNVSIGYNAGYNNALGSNNVFIGNQAGENELGSNKLYISNSNTASPLIYGDFTNKKVTINSVLIIKPRPDAPLAPVEGEIYVSSVTHHIYCYLSGAWKQLDN